MSKFEDWVEMVFSAIMGDAYIIRGDQPDTKFVEELRERLTVEFDRKYPSEKSLNWKKRSLPDEGGPDYFGQ